MTLHPLQIPLWQQLQVAAAVVLAVRAGQSLTAALDGVDAALRPGVQSLAFHTLRQLGRAEALRQRLVSRPPPPEADALLCVALSLAVDIAQQPEIAEPPADRHLHSVGHADESRARYTPFTLVDQTVEAAKRADATRHQASFINGCLRRFLREQGALMAQTDGAPQAVWNHPQWWIDRLRRDHPAHWQAILQANNTPAPLHLRVNSRKTTVAQYLSVLDAAGIEAAAVGQGGVVLTRAQAVPSLPGYAEGHFSVQDAAAQLAAPLLLAATQRLDPNTGQAASQASLQPPARLRILDACAAPGGKTAHLLELADCDVTALDIDARRCQRIDENLTRLGLQAQIVVGDAAQPALWWDGQLFDAILLDAPCTASGIVRRHPDVRWLRRPGDVAQLAAVQAGLLQALWPLLKVGGAMVYCTCSVFLAEGEGQIKTFLAHHTDAVLRPSPGHLLPQSGGQAVALPDNLIGGHDGFYYAVLQKEIA